MDLATKAFLAAGKGKEPSMDLEGFFHDNIPLLP